MEKKYLLLRSNKESGPYWFGELLQQQLKNKDLIWIENESQCWSYASEIEELKPYFSPSIPTNNLTEHKLCEPCFASFIRQKETAGSTAFATIEKSAGEQRKHAFDRQGAYTASVLGPGKRIKDENESDNFRFVFHKRKKNPAVHQLFTTGIILILLITAWHLGWSPINQPADSDKQAVKLVSGSTHAATAAKHYIQQPPVAIVMNAPVKTTSTSKKSKQTKAKVSKIDKPFISVHEADVNQKIHVTSEIIPANDQLIITPIVTGTGDRTQNSDKEEKKKTIGQVIKNLFHKKKNKGNTEE